MFDDYVQYDGLGLAELIAKREVSAEEVLEAAIHLAEQRNPELNAIVTPLYDYARARAAEDLSGPFAGVPFLLKDAHHALEGTPNEQRQSTPQGGGVALHRRARSPIPGRRPWSCSARRIPPSTSSRRTPCRWLGGRLATHGTPRDRREVRAGGSAAAVAAGDRTHGLRDG